MSLPILSLVIRQEHDTVNARQRARQIARILGFDGQDQTRIATAVSEIARNAFNYAGGGKVDYLIEGRTAPQLFIIRISDNGSGIPNLADIQDGLYESKTGMGLGILGARRLMDQCQIDTNPGKGTVVLLKKLLPRRTAILTEKDLGRMATELASERPQTIVQELQHQNGELMQALDDVRMRQQELARVNRELEDTNRGVVALYAELDEKADHLRRADELKSKFLSNMSHEFRSPLNSILALSGLLRDQSDGELTPDQKQQVGYIRKAANDLLELVNDLLDLAKVEAGKLEARPVEFQMDNLFAALRGMLRPLLVNASVDLVFDDASHIPVFFSDEGKISQILRNFISNALKFTEQGEVRVSAELAPGGADVILSVSDTGIGIAPEDQEAIFQDFVQVDHAIQRRVKGTGLGLPLSRKLAIFLGGRVDVTSRHGIGSVFWATIPLRYKDPAELPPPAVDEWIPDPHRRPVLFVEDSPEMVLAYKSHLRGTSFQPVAANTIREADFLLDVLQPCAIVLDIALRSEETWYFIPRLKEDARVSSVPILVVSTIEDRAKGYHLGADGWIVKPVERAQLLRQLYSLTGKKEVKRILLIDDSELDRYLLKQLLRNYPFSIQEESNPAQGIVAAQEHPPDLIFLDLVMPGMSGFEVLDQLKGIPETSEVPVVIVTSQILSGPDRERLLAKAVSIISKQHMSSESIRDVMRSTLKDVEIFGLAD